LVWGNFNILRKEHNTLCGFSWYIYVDMFI